MKQKIVKCDYCKKSVQLETCEFATQYIKDNSKEHVFCCKMCAENYKQKIKKKN